MERAATQVTGLRELGELACVRRMLAAFLG
jgi:hypothetical protein